MMSIPRWAGTIFLGSLLALGAFVAVPASVQASGNAAETYELNLDAPASLKKGEKATVKVSVAPQGAWHMNLDFPSSVSVEAEGGVKVAKTKLSKGDAKRLDDGGLVFEVPVEAVKAGSARVHGKIRFAVCQDNACAPKSETVEWKLAVAGK